MLTTLAALATLATLATLLASLAGSVLAALLLLTGFLLPAATLLSAATLLRVALALLLVALRIVLARIIRHWDVLQSFRGILGEGPSPTQSDNAGRWALFPSRHNEIAPND
jgi:hypothetical protein